MAAMSSRLVNDCVTHSAYIGVQGLGVSMHIFLELIDHRIFYSLSSWVATGEDTKIGRYKSFYCFYA